MHTHAPVATAAGTRARAALAPAGPYRGPTSGLSVWNLVSPTLSHLSFYKLHHRDPIFFRDGMRFVWRNGDITDAQGFKCIAQTGTPIANPSAANVSTLVYAYVW